LKHKKEQVRTKHTYKVLQEEEDISMESHDDGTVPSLKDPEEDTSRAGNRSYEVDNVSMKDLEEEIDRYKKDDKSGSVEYDASTKKRNDEIIGLKGKLMDAERMYAEAEKKYHELDAWYAERVNHLNAEVASLKEKALEEENKRKDLTDRYKANDDSDSVDSFAMEDLNEEEKIYVERMKNAVRIIGNEEDTERRGTVNTRDDGIEKMKKQMKSIRYQNNTLMFRLEKAEDTEERLNKELQAIKEASSKKEVLYVDKVAALESALKKKTELLLNALKNKGL
jgi:ACT domain-containing protein